MSGMQVVLFRHGPAEDRETFSRTGRPDRERPLTDKGARRTRQAAGGLASLLPGANLVGASPYTRARQTADIIAEVYEDAGRSPEKLVVDAMQPGAEPEDVCRLLAARSSDAAAVLVGHEPDLSSLMAWLTSGQPDGFAHFGKAAACLIELPASPARGSGELLWFLPPSILRRLAES
jgi:phosphohistidine phosphatase